MGIRAQISCPRRARFLASRMAINRLSILLLWPSGLRDRCSAWDASKITILGVTITRDATILPFPAGLILRLISPEEGRPASDREFVAEFIVPGSYALVDEIRSMDLDLKL